MLQLGPCLAAPRQESQCPGPHAAGLTIAAGHREGWQTCGGPPSGGQSHQLPPCCAGDHELRQLPPRPGGGPGGPEGGPQGYDPGFPGGGKGAYPPQGGFHGGRGGVSPTAHQLLQVLLAETMFCA